MRKENIDEIFQNFKFISERIRQLFALFFFDFASHGDFKLIGRKCVVNDQNPIEKVGAYRSENKIINK